jgi:hypothetical protein
MFYSKYPIYGLGFCLVGSSVGVPVLRNEQIMSLSEQLSKVKTEEEALQIASQLKAVLHEHLETIRGNLLVSIAPEIADGALLNPAPDPPKVA